MEVLGTKGSSIDIQPIITSAQAVLVEQVA